MAERPESYRYSSYRAFIVSKAEGLIFRDLIWGDGARSYREFVEAGLIEKPKNPFEKGYGGVILGGKTFIEEVLHQLNDQDLRKKERSHRRALGLKPFDIDEMVDFVSNYFKISREKVQTTFPYKGYAVYLTRKYTPISNKEIGRYFGGISYSAITKIGTRIKERMKRDRNLREEIIQLQERLSRVKD